MFRFTINFIASGTNFTNIKFALHNSWFLNRPKVANIVDSDNGVINADYDTPKLREISFDDTIDGAGVLFYLRDKVYFAHYEMTVRYNPDPPLFHGMDVLKSGKNLKIRLEP
jgi:hypothetical protein